MSEVKVDANGKVDPETRQLLLSIMAYLYWYPGHEGKGGKKRDPLLQDDWWVGTRLRAPHFPLWERNPDERTGLLKFLLEQEMIKVMGEPKEEFLKNKWEITDAGKEVLYKLNKRLVFYTSWYKWMNTGIVWSTQCMAFIEPEEAHRRYTGGSPYANSGVHINKIFYYEYETSMDA